uniref:Peptidase A1 domain-containing protein n=1 Tax=Physcomitrium patens TaxID=3218 RepID=A0A7I4ELK1_PHYPA
RLLALVRGPCSYYTATVPIGWPPQAFALIVDTGSTITYVPCSSCSHCVSHQDPRFKPNQSSTYTAIHCDDLDCEMGTCIYNNQCSYARHYVEQSYISGRDFVRLGVGSFALSRSLIFGCETTESGNLYSQLADGIMGLARGSFAILNAQGAIASAFSLCYGGMDEEGGTVILGAILPSYGMIRIQGEPLPVKPSVFDGRDGTILDSGTMFAYLPEKTFNAFRDAVRTSNLIYASAAAGIARLS